MPEATFVTVLQPDEFAAVATDLAAMLDVGDTDEAWRILRLFAAGGFNYGLADLPAPLRRAAAALGTDRHRSYRALLDRVRAAATGPFRYVELGTAHGWPLVKLASTGPASPDTVRMPLAIVGGIHGDELDSVLGPLELARRLAGGPGLAAAYALTIYPCVNPTG